MNRPSIVNQTTARILYFRYKDFFVPVIVIFVCILLVFQVIIPQIQQIFSLNDQIAATNGRIAVLEKNITTATQLDDTQLSSQLQVALRALPSQKDFVGIVAAISNAAVAANVPLGDYAFQVGDIGKVDTSQKQTTVQLTITIGGGINDVQRFLEALKKQLPLSDVTEVHVLNSSLSSVNIVFYYKPLPQIQFKESNPLPVLSQSENDLLQSLSLVNTVGQTPSASPAASLQ